MASHIPLLLYFLILFYLSTATSSDPFPPLLALNCTSPPSHLHLKISKQINFLLLDLTLKATQTRFATSSFGLEPDRIEGLMQCQLDLFPTECTVCVETAILTISTHCLNSEAATVWFNGCYVHYYNTHKFSSAINATEFSQWSPSNSSMDQVDQFSLALETWISKLRVAVLSHQSSHNVIQFSYSKVVYGSKGERIFYGLAECIQLVSRKDCEVCLRESTNKLHEHCCRGGEDYHRSVVGGSCMVGFGYNQHYYLSNATAETGGSDVFIFDENESSTDSSSLELKEKVAKAWSVGVACFIVIVLGAWYLRRNAVNTAKVGSVNAGSAEEETGK